MLQEEARWFREQLAAHEPSLLFPLLNVGSSTAHFRTVTQPWIDAEIFAPLRAQGARVIHLDLKDAPGVDRVGDLMDPAFRAQLADEGIRSLLCSNLLEHVGARAPLADALVRLLPPGGLLFLSCPYRYPYHPDPIDTMFRPDVAELAALFPDCTPLSSATVTGYTFWGQINRGPLALAKLAVRMLVPFYRPKTWFSILCHLPWLFRPFQATCLVLQKIPSS